MLLTVIVPRYIAPSVIVIVINEPDSPPRIRRNFGDDTHFTITTVYNFVARLYMHSCIASGGIAAVSSTVDHEQCSHRTVCSAIRVLC